MINDFKLICVEGADKCGKTTLCNAIKEAIPTIQYRHFTACNKATYMPEDIPLQRNVNVLYQFYRFFEKNFFGYNFLSTPWLLDRTLYSDIVYGPIYRGIGDELVVRTIEKNYFTMMLQGLGCIFIFADNRNSTSAYEHIVTEGEGIINSSHEYDALRTSYRNMISDVMKTSNITWLPYDFNSTTTDAFIKGPLYSALVKPDYILDNLRINRSFGSLLGTTKPTKKTSIYRLSGPLDAPITMQEYANLVADTGMRDLSIDSPVMASNKYCIVRKRSFAEYLVDKYIDEL